MENDYNLKLKQKTQKLLLKKYKTNFLYLKTRRIDLILCNERNKLQIEFENEKEYLAKKECLRKLYRKEDILKKLKKLLRRNCKKISPLCFQINKSLFFLENERKIEEENKTNKAENLEKNKEKLIEKNKRNKVQAFNNTKNTLDKEIKYQINQDQNFEELQKKKTLLNINYFEKSKNEIKNNSQAKKEIKSKRVMKKASFKKREKNNHKERKNLFNSLEKQKQIKLQKIRINFNCSPIVLENNKEGEIYKKVDQIKIDKKEQLKVNDSEKKNKVVKEVKKNVKNEKLEKDRKFGESFDSQDNIFLNKFSGNSSSIDLIDILSKESSENLFKILSHESSSRISIKMNSKKTSKIFSKSFQNISKNLLSEELIKSSAISIKEKNLDFLLESSERSEKVSQYISQTSRFSLLKKTNELNNYHEKLLRKLEKNLNTDFSKSSSFSFENEFGIEKPKNEKIEIFNIFSPVFSSKENSYLESLEKQKMYEKKEEKKKNNEMKKSFNTSDKKTKNFQKVNKKLFIDNDKINLVQRKEDFNFIKKENTNLEKNKSFLKKNSNENIHLKKLRKIVKEKKIPKSNSIKKILLFNNRMCYISPHIKSKKKHNKDIKKKEYEEKKTFLTFSDSFSLQNEISFFKKLENSCISDNSLNSINKSEKNEFKDLLYLLKNVLKKSKNEKFQKIVYNSKEKHFQKYLDPSLKKKKNSFKNNSKSDCKENDYKINEEKNHFLKKTKVKKCNLNSSFKTTNNNKSYIEQVEKKNIKYIKEFNRNYHQNDEPVNQKKVDDNKIHFFKNKKEKNSYNFEQRKLTLFKNRSVKKNQNSDYFGEFERKYSANIDKKKNKSLEKPYKFFGIDYKLKLKDYSQKKNPKLTSVFSQYKLKKNEKQILDSSKLAEKFQKTSEKTPNYFYDLKKKILDKRISNYNFERKNKIEITQEKKSVMENSNNQKDNLDLMSENYKNELKSGNLRKELYSPKKNFFNGYKKLMSSYDKKNRTNFSLSKFELKNKIGTNEKFLTKYSSKHSNEKIKKHSSEMNMKKTSRNFSTKNLKPFVFSKLGSTLTKKFSKKFSEPKFETINNKKLPPQNFFKYNKDSKKKNELDEYAYYHNENKNKHLTPARISFNFPHKEHLFN